VVPEVYRRDTIVQRDALIQQSRDQRLAGRPRPARRAADRALSPAAVFRKQQHFSIGPIRM